MNLFLILFLISCGKGANNDPSTRKDLESKYINPDDDFQSRKEEEDAVPNGKDENLDESETRRESELNYYNLLIDNEIALEDVIRDIENDKEFSNFEKENLLKKLIDNDEIDQDKKISIIERLYNGEMNVVSLINYAVNLLNEKNVIEYKKVIEFFINQNLSDLKIEEIFENFINKIEELKIKKDNSELESIGKSLLDKYFKINLIKNSNLKVAKDFLNLYLTKRLSSQEFNKEMILYIIRKVEDDPLNSSRKKLVEELKQKYKQNSFILELVSEEIK